MKEVCKLLSHPDKPHFLVAKADGAQPLIVVECLTRPSVVQSLRLPNVLSQSSHVNFRGIESEITHHNGKRVVPNTCLTLHHADVVAVRPIEHTLRVGGHPASNGVPPLNANATFEQRCEWAVNTFGWTATDELQFAFDAMNLPRHVITYLGYWNKQRQCLENGPFGSLELNSEGPTWCAVLVDNHWVAADVSRQGDKASINIRGAPPDLARLIAYELARRMDLNPLRVPLSHSAPLTADNMCGWDALLFWHTAAGNDPHVFPDFEAFYGLAPNMQDQIWEVMHSSWEEWQKTTASVNLRNFAWVTRFNFFVHLAAINKSQLSTHCGPVIATTDPHPPKVADTNQPSPPLVDANGPLETRLCDLQRAGGLLSSDMLDSTLDFLRHAHLDVLFAPPVSWDPQEDKFEFFEHLECNPAPYHHIHLPILWNQRWIQCEIMRHQHHAMTIVAVPDPSFALGRLAVHIASWISTPLEQVHFTVLCQNMPSQISGWMYMHALFVRYGMVLPQPSPAQNFTLLHHKQARLFESVKSAMHLTWISVWASADLIQFANAAATHFLHRLAQQRCSTHYAAGGAKGKENKTEPNASSQQPDPWTKSDPWQKSKKPVQTRWEDLLLLPDHPFRTKDDAVIPQVHRVQITGKQQGLVLTTKTNLNDLALIKATATFAALIPALDPATVKGNEIKSLGPYEVILKDEAMQTTYKRLVSVVVFHGDVVYKLENPVHAFKTDAIAEIVLELDSRLVTKDEFDAARSNPQQTFRRLLQDNMPDVAGKATLYGFRTNHHPSAAKEDSQVQCMLKIPACHRKTILSFSGKQAMLARDFLERGSATSDTSILPKFWGVTMRGLRELNIAASPTPGSAGIALTRRGLALRVWSDTMGQARKCFMSDDPRICSINLDTIPKFTFEAAGWPPGLEAKDVVESTHKATGAAAIPTRTFRAAGVHTWILVFQDKPKLQKFNIQINSGIYEILLREAPLQPPPKGQGKGKTSKKEAPMPPAAPAPQLTMFHTDKQRIDQLEARFDKLGQQVAGIEDRQGVFERRFDARFGEISDSLRQLLQQSQPRGKEASGETPPAKQQKHN